MDNCQNKQTNEAWIPFFVQHHLQLVWTFRSFKDHMWFSKNTFPKCHWSLILPAGCVCGCGWAPADSLWRLWWTGTVKRLSSCWPLPDTVSTEYNMSHTAPLPAEARNRWRVTTSTNIIINIFSPLLHKGLVWWLISVQHKVSPCATGVAHLFVFKSFWVIV